MSCCHEIAGLSRALLHVFGSELSKVFKGIGCLVFLARSGFDGKDEED